MTFSVKKELRLLLCPQASLESAVPKDRREIRERSVSLTQKEERRSRQSVHFTETLKP